VKLFPAWLWSAISQAAQAACAAQRGRSALESKPGTSMAAQCAFFCRPGKPNGFWPSFDVSRVSRLRPAKPALPIDHRRSCKRVRQITLLLAAVAVPTIESFLAEECRHEVRDLDIVQFLIGEVPVTVDSYVREVYE
jgi:hypothetical protein